MYPIREAKHELRSWTELLVVSNAVAPLSFETHRACVQILSIVAAHAVTDLEERHTRFEVVV